MALNTNGWDYIYTLTTTTLNQLIKAEATANTEAFKNLFADSITGNDTGIGKTFSVSNIIKDALEVLPQLLGLRRVTPMAGIFFLTSEKNFQKHPFP